MKQSACFFAFSFCFCLTLFAGDTLVIAEKNRVSLGMESAFYTSAESKYYFLHFIIYNKTDKTIGVDLSNPRETVFLNQLEVDHDTGQLFIHNELFNRYERRTEEEAKKIKSAYASSQLTMVEPGKTIDYYREFRGGEIEASKSLFNNFVFLSLFLNGRLSYTDGETVEDFIPDYSGVNYMYGEDGKMKLVPGYFDRNIKILGPAEWKTIPKGALISKL